jgi:hypothetical protein
VSKASTRHSLLCRVSKRGALDKEDSLPSARTRRSAKITAVSFTRRLTVVCWAPSFVECIPVPRVLLYMWHEIELVQLRLPLNYQNLIGTHSVGYVVPYICRSGPLVSIASSTFTSGTTSNFPIYPVMLSWHAWHISAFNLDYKSWHDAINWSNFGENSMHAQTYYTFRPCIYI